MDIFFINLRPHLKELSDVKIQRKVWLNEDNDTGKISSFTELYHGIMSDCALEEIVNNPVYWEGVPQGVIIELRDLGIELDAFADRVFQIKQHESADFLESVMRNPEWIKISQHAPRILEMWK